MTSSAHDCPTALDLAREEAWVLHAALLTTAEQAVDEGEDPETAVSLLARLEDDDDFERDELAYFADALRDYLEGTPPSRDRGPAERALDDIRATLA